MVDVFVKTDLCLEEHRTEFTLFVCLGLRDFFQALDCLLLQ